MVKKQELSTVLSCSPQTQICYSGVEKQLLLVEKPKFQKHQRTFAFLSTKSTITTQVSVSKDIADEDLFDIIENAAYDDLGLDIATEYKIDYFERLKETDSASRVFEVFIVEPQALSLDFDELVTKVRYIDEIIPQSLLIQTLYKKEILESDKTDLFVYFNEHDAFLALYKEGEFLYTKDLDFSLESLYEMYCQICGDRIEYEDFVFLLTQKGLRTEKEDEKAFLIKLITQMLSQINEILNFAKRTFNLDTVHRIFIGTSNGPIHGIDEFTQTILGLESQNFDFDYGFEKGEHYIDQIHQLLHLTASVAKEERYNCNLTTFPPPPDILKRESGRLLAITAASLVISLALPLYNIAYASFTSIMQSSLEKEQRQLHQEKIQRESDINKLVAQRQELEKKKKDALEIQKTQKEILTKIYVKKVQYPMKAKIITDLTQDLNTFNVQLMQIDYQSAPQKEGHTFLLKMTAAKEKNITTMIEKLTRDNLKNYTTTMQELVYSDALGLYLCDLKVELKLENFNLETKAGS